MMHIQGTPLTMQQNPIYDDVVAEVRAFFIRQLAKLNEKGKENIILDPGFGFGKEIMHNYALLRNLGHLSDLGYPLLAGISRKSMISKVLKISPKEALNGTTVLNTIALMHGANILRVHDVKEAIEAVKLVNELWKAK
jgi:dihydropteroate synthase